MLLRLIKVSKYLRTTRIFNAHEGYETCVLQETSVDNFIGTFKKFDVRFGRKNLFLNWWKYWPTDYLMRLNVAFVKLVRNFISSSFPRTYISYEYLSCELYYKMSV